MKPPGGRDDRKPIRRNKSEKGAQFLCELRAGMRVAAELSGLSLAEIGIRMGVPSDRFPKTVVWRLLNSNRNPSIVDVMLFCEALALDMRKLLPRRKPYRG